MGVRGSGLGNCGVSDDSGGGGGYDVERWAALVTCLIDAVHVTSGSSVHVPSYTYSHASPAFWCAVSWKKSERRVAKIDDHYKH